jgi:Leucine-rich repeat (LRR) protein
MSEQLALAEALKAPAAATHVYVTGTDWAPELLQLPALESLSIRDGTTPDPRFFALGVKRLELWGCDADVKALVRGLLSMPKLRALSIQSVTLKAFPRALCALTALEELELALTKTSGLPPEFVKLQKLRVFEGRQFHPRGDLALLGQMPALERVMISEGAATELPVELLTLPRLRALDMGSNRLVQLPALTDAQVAASRLEQLDLTFNKVKVFPPELYALPKLKALRLDDNPIATVDGIGAAAGLEVLGLASCRKLRALPGELFTLKRLQDLDLSCLPIKALPEALGDLKALRRLEMWRTGCVALPARLTELVQLEELDVSEHPLGALPADLDRLQRLRVLRANEAELAAFPTAVLKLPGLELLNLRRNAIPDAPEGLGGLTTLKALLLDGNPLPALPKALARLGALESLYASGTGITSFPFDLSAWPRLKVLELVRCPLPAAEKARLQAAAAARPGFRLWV